MERIAVVSGGGTGIGRAIGRALAGDGVHVVLLGRRAAVVEAAAAEISADTPGGASWRQVDVSQPHEVQALADHLRQEHGEIAAVVNNAGGSTRLPTDTLEEVAAHWRAAYEQNVITAVLLTHGLLPLLRRPGGRIILISSMATRSGGGAPAYGAAKAALHGWVLALTAQHARDGITSNVIAPGYTPDTELFGDGMPQELHDRIVSRIAVGRAGRSDDTAAAARYLVSPDASFVTGQVIEVSGGLLPPNM